MLQYLKQKIWSLVRSRRVWVFLGVCLFTFIIEHTFTHALESGPGNALTAPFVDVAQVYERLVTAGPRSHVPRFTAIVEIKAPREPASVSFLNVCEQRGFLDRLIQKIAAQSPSVIVVDKYFGADTCDRCSAGTKGLTRTVRELRAAGTPVIVGQLVNEEGHLVPTLDLDADSCPAESVTPASHRADTGAGPEWLGVVNVHPDERRLALSFNLDGARRLTLASLAAQAHDGTLFTTDSALGKMSNGDVHPYVGFLAEDEFAKRTLPAIDLLCGPANQRTQTWPACEEQWKGSAPIGRQLRGRIVVVGENAPTIDQHQPVASRRFPGYMLQANYIEAILDEQIFPPAPTFVNYALGFLIYLAFEVILALVKSFPLVLVGTAVVLASGLVLTYLLVVHLGVYMNPATVSTLAIVVRLLGQLPERSLTRAH